MQVSCSLDDISLDDNSLDDITAPTLSLAVLTFAHIFTITIKSTALPLNTERRYYLSKLIENSKFRQQTKTCIQNNPFCSLIKHITIIIQKLNLVF